MNEKIPYETPNVYVVEFTRMDDIVTSSIVDNDGDYREWESGGDAW